MRWMRSATVVGLLAVVMVLVPTGPACACSCAELSAREAVAIADAVFVGTVKDVSAPWFGPFGSGADLVTLTFDVDTVYKGDVPANARVRTARDGPTCGFSATPGARYLVHVRQSEDGERTTSSCSGNRRLAADEIPAAGGYAPAPAVAYPNGWRDRARLGGALVAAVGLGVLIGLMARRRGRTHTVRSGDRPSGGTAGRTTS